MDLLGGPGQWWKSPSRRSSLSPLINGVINWDDVNWRKGLVDAGFASYVPSGNVNCAEDVGNQFRDNVDTEAKHEIIRRGIMDDHVLYLIVQKRPRLFILRYTTLLKGHLAAGDMTSAWKLVEDMEVSWQSFILLSFFEAFLIWLGWWLVHSLCFRYEMPFVCI